MATTLFPDIGNLYLDSKDRSLQDQMRHFYTMSQPMTQSFWWEAAIDSRYEAGDSSVFSEVYGNMPSLRRKQFTFNKIRPSINLVEGYQRKNRKSIIATPVENADQKTADQFSKIMIWHQQREGVQETISTAFRGALVTGLNLLNLWMDWSRDPVSGDIKVDAVPYNAYIIDPYFTKKDLSDCQGIWRRQYLSPRALALMYPEHKEFILSYSGWNNAVTEGLFPLMPENFGPDFRKRMPYDQYFYPTIRKQTLLVDTITGETFEWNGNNDEVLRQFLFFKPQVSVMENPEYPTVNVALLVNGKAVYAGPQPSGLDSYPFVPVFGYFNPQIPEYHLRIQGIVRSQRDPQFLYNRRMAIELDCLESVVNSGWIFKENSLIDPSSVYFNGQGRGIGLKEEAQMTDVQPIVPPVIPPTTQSLRETLSRDLTEVTGISQENLGINTEDMSGILSMVRQSAGLTGLQPLLEQLDGSMKLLGTKVIQMIQRNFTPGKVSRIIEEEPTSQFYNRTFGVYDCVVEEGFNTSTQRQLEFAQLVQLKQLNVAGVTDDALLNAATIQNKDKLVQNAVRMQEQQAQIEQARQQVEMQELGARINLANARAEEAIGLRNERNSRVAENHALAFERMAEANKDDELAVLHKVKAIKELESMDLAQLEKLVQLAQLLKQNERQDTEEQKEPLASLDRSV